MTEGAPQPGPELGVDGHRKVTAIDTMGYIDLFCANAGVGVGGGLDTSDE